MVFGKLHLTADTLTTHNDSYVLSGLSAVSTRRPFLSSAIAMAALLILLGLGTIDILYAGEMLLIAASAGLFLGLGLTIGQLRLVSRDLRGSPIADAVYGTYGHLTRERLKIAVAVQASNRGGRP